MAVINKSLRSRVYDLYVKNRSDDYIKRRLNISDEHLKGILRDFKRAENQTICDVRLSCFNKELDNEITFKERQRKLISPLVLSTNDEIVIMAFNRLTL